ncbi:HalOD1 output domain-containing protein [Natrinema versiforme]
MAAAVDPAALETLIDAPTASNLEVRFTYRGHDVVVDAEGRVQVC